jgi:hypothetical protein
MQKNRRQEGEEASFDGGDVNVEQREKSKRRANPNATLRGYVCDEDSPLSGEESSEPGAPVAAPKRARKTTSDNVLPAPISPAVAAKRGGKKVALEAASPAPTTPVTKVKASTRKAGATAAPPAPAAPVAVISKRSANKKAAKAAPPAPAAPVVPVAVSKRKPKGVAAKRGRGVDLTATIPSVPVVNRASGPPRKRLVDPSVEAAAAAAAAAAATAVEIDMAIDDAAVFEEIADVGYVPDIALVKRTLLPHLAHVSNTIVDDYIRLLKRKMAKSWPLVTLLETTGRWVHFSMDVVEREKIVDALFARGDRLVGITRVVWPMFGKGHFALLVIDVEARIIRLLDSIPGFEWDLRWFQAFLRRAFDWDSDAIVVADACRSQGNGDDCGVYTMGNMRSILESVDVNDSRMPGAHLTSQAKKAGVLALRAHFANEITRMQLIDWN